MGLTGYVDPEEEALVAASMALFAQMGPQHRRTVHLLMTTQMESSMEEIWLHAGEEYR
jgi:hypothetical protein